MGKVDSKSSKNVKVITGELQHNLVMADIEEKKKKKQSVGLDVKNEMFEYRPKESMSDDHDDLWGCFKESVLKANDEV